MKLELKKFNPLENDIICVDGLWGTGKSLLSPIVNNMKKVEMVKLEMVYEYICIMQHLEQISPEAALFILQSYANDSQYNNLIGRHTNLRWNDASGLSNNPNKIQAIMRLFGREGDHVMRKINSNNIALHIMTHMIMLVSDQLFETYGERLKLIEVVRHPLYMVKHWHSYLQRFDSQRELTVCIDHKSHKVPWFAISWADEFIEATLMDRVLMSIVRLFHWLEDSIEKAAVKGSKLLVLSFEELVMTPDQPMNQLELFLGRTHHPNLQSILRREKIPRDQISKGKGSYAYGWMKTNDENEWQAYKRNLDFIRENGSVEHVDNLLKLIEKYNEKYSNHLAIYQ
jgi:hypothetical protein